ncbi:uncharacterized protein [Watersipora subatra]|uniref:uncharacterized protein n=1 Tax=Watersipora subatra TaxID=2589382 RepID=UPI00355C5366
MSVRILNKPVKDSGSSAEAKSTLAEDMELSRALQKLIKKIKGEFTMADGVDYVRIRSSQLYADFEALTNQLTSVDLESYSKDERKAFFINVYNTLTIHGIVSMAELPDSVLKVQKFWEITCYQIGAHVFSLDDIEHGILRANRSHPASVKPTYFPEGDVRVKYALDTLDPRIHFALNCGAKSCPAISAYDAENLDKALDAATKLFCNQEVIVLPKNEEVYVSKLFEWYGSDFGSNDIAAVKWMLPYLDEPKHSELALLLQGILSVGAGQVLYNEYDWRLNSTFG